MLPVTLAVVSPCRSAACRIDHRAARVGIVACEDQRTEVGLVEAAGPLDAAPIVAVIEAPPAVPFPIGRSCRRGRRQRLARDRVALTRTARR